MSDYVVQSGQAFSRISDSSVNGNAILDASDGCSLSLVPESGYIAGDEQGEFLQSASSSGWTIVIETGEKLVEHKVVSGGIGHAEANVIGADGANQEDAGEEEVVADTDGNNTMTLDVSGQGDEIDASSATAAEIEGVGEEDIHVVASNLKRRLMYAYNPSRCPHL